MYILAPVFHETLWGGKKLGNYAEKVYDRIGHMYIVNGHEDMSNMIRNGSEKGKTLKQAFDDKKEEWQLQEYKEFPLTIALVDANQNLSIQVHPDGKTAEKLEGKRIGKTESWLFLDAPISGWIYAGCSCDVAERVGQAVHDGKMEEITAHFPVNQWDYVTVQAGTLHAMTEGSFVYEIEYGSDYTYRFYDYDRIDAQGNTRELHIEKALQAIIPEQNVKKRSLSGESGWIAEECYEIKCLSDIKQYENTGKEIECIAVVDGSGYADCCHIISGMGILLFPGEKLEQLEAKQVVVARIRR